MVLWSKRKKVTSKYQDQPSWNVKGIYVTEVQGVCLDETLSGMPDKILGQI